MTLSRNRAGRPLAPSQPLPAGGLAARAVWLVLPLLLALASPVRAEARALPESFADLAEALIPVVVNIATTQALPTPWLPATDTRRAADAT